MSSQGADLKGLNGELHIVAGAGRAGKVKNEVELFIYEDIVSDIVMDKEEVLIVKMAYVLNGAGDQIIHTDDGEISLQEILCQVGTDETRTSSNEHPFFHS